MYRPYYSYVRRFLYLLAQETDSFPIAFLQLNIHLLNFINTVNNFFFKSRKFFSFLFSPTFFFSAKKKEKLYIFLKTDNEQVASTGIRTKYTRRTRKKSFIWIHKPISRASTDARSCIRKPTPPPVFTTAHDRIRKLGKPCNGSWTRTTFEIQSPLSILWKR